MKRLVKHLGFLRHIDEFRFKRWLDGHAFEVLNEIGVKESQVILDFGCGSGTYAIPAANIVGYGGTVYALDVSDRALDRLEAKASQAGLENIERIDYSGEGKIGLDDEVLDHVFLIDVLQEVEDRETLFDEAYRMLKRGGTITVYPMHIRESEVIELARKRRLSLDERIFYGRLLIFRKPYD